VGVTVGVVVGDFVFVEVGVAVWALAADATSTTDSARNPANRFASLVSRPTTRASVLDAGPASFVPRRPRPESAAAREDKPMKSRAAVANQAGKPLSMEKPSECRQCAYCVSRKTNLCQAIRETQGKGGDV